MKFTTYTEFLTEVDHSDWEHDETIKFVGKTNRLEKWFDPMTGTEYFIFVAKNDEIQFFCMDIQSLFARSNCNLPERERVGLKKLICKMSVSEL